MNIFINNPLFIHNGRIFTYTPWHAGQFVLQYLPHLIYSYNLDYSSIIVHLNQTNKMSVLDSYGLNRQEKDSMFLVHRANIALVKKYLLFINERPYINESP